ncbi:choice-of-anchor D domain-containing protein [Terriglobus saanensis]|uniref:Endonuclease/exonuclease/phosphatase n=1 Tax=Terriglobus saanensis (strain ATCC BAA-1853 / DSM 23119 / SP1PR4) TaxID=401053 RepID=E8V274_TERSS|nr:choice-of-anchor D domain-containing protein [Terriglobus saanensis]ADV81207.1 Endonuclease/exonuclease/phosphatase [Terriglobus saanensis SP1PR4]
MMFSSPRFFLRAIRSVFSLTLAVTATSMVAQTSVSIHDVMKNLPNSPYLGSAVSITTGIVVGVLSDGSFYISEPSGNWDSLVTTAEGMLVVPPTGATCAAVGNQVTVIGTVKNTTDLTAANTPGTYLAATTCTATATNQTMTQAISVSSVLTTFGDALQYTGMAASNSSFYAIAPTSGTLDETNETVTSNGQFWATLNSNTTTNNHLYRTTGIAGDEFVPASAPSGVTKWGGNPQRILIDTTTLGGTAVNITVGQSITCSVPSNITAGATKGIGLIDYTLGYARLLIFKSSACTVGGSVAATTSAVADATHFKVGTLDLNRFYSTLAAIGSTPISASAYARQLSKAANAIVNAFGSPDILSLQEMQDAATLTDLQTAISSAGTVYDSTCLITGNDTASLNLGFLVKSTVTVDSCTQAGKSDTYTTAAGGSGTLWERPPLVLKGEFVRVGKNYPFYVIDVHLTPRDNIGDTTLGPDVRAHRAAQAAALSALVQQYQTAGGNVIVAGNFNAYEYSDGYVDVLGVVTGSPASATTVTLYTPTSTTAALNDFTTSIATLQRYNIIERGNAASLEHILASATVPDSSTASASLASYMTDVTQPHFSTDFAAINTNDTTTAAGLTPHDGQVVAFLIPPVPTTASISPTTLNFGDVFLGATASLPVTVANTTTFTSTVAISKIAISGTNASDFTETDNCTSLAENATCTITVTFAPSAVGTRTGTLTVTTDSTSNPTLTVSLTGNGEDTTATLTPASATFASTYAGGGVSAAQIFTLTNTSTVAIAVKSVAVSAQFADTTACGASLAAGASCTISVTFVPTTAGAVTGTLTVLTNTSGNPTLTSALNGTGLQTTATLTPASNNFGNILLGSTSTAQSFVWTNTSAIPLKVTAYSVTGDFTIASSTCGTVAAGASCLINVAFTPTVLGARTGVLTVTSTASANATLTATLSGRGVADVEASVSSLSFGNIDVGFTSAAQVVTITNYTTSAIALTGITTSGDYSDSTTCGVALAGLSTCTVSVVFKPTAIGVRTGALVLTTNDTKYPVITVALTGNGVDFSVALSPTSGAVIAGFGTTTAATVTPLGGFSAAVTLTCTSNAIGSVCTSALASLVPNAASPVTLSISTTSKYTAIGYGGLGGGSWIALLLAALSAAGLWISRRGAGAFARIALAMLLMAAVCLGAAGCAGGLGQNAPYTEPGTYTYTVTATDGQLVRSATYSLSVTAK